MRSILILGLLCLVLQAPGQAVAQASNNVFRPLPEATLAEFQRQRAYVASLVAQHLPGRRLQKTQQDFAILQQIIDRRLIPADKTWELRALGVVFGDVLANSIAGLAWWEVTDDYGTDPTLRYKTTALQVNALTMLAKRVRDGKPVDVARLAAGVEDFVKNEAPRYE